MDTSKEYVLMCEKAVEVQELRPFNKEFQEADFYACWDKHHHYEGKYPNGKHIADWSTGAISDDGEYGLPDRIEGYYWLPRQDQLQGMVRVDKRNDYQFVYRLNDFVEKFNAGELAGNPSMEQLWLAFVMKEKFDKVWNGTDWEES